MTRCAVFLFVMVSWSSSTAAQPPRTYVGGGLMLSTQKAATPCVSGSGCARPGIGGSAWGVIGEIGRFVSPAMSVGVEISVPQRFETIQATSIPNERIDNRHRDLTISGLLHGYTPRTGSVRAALVGGGGFVHENTIQRFADAPFGSSSFGPYGPDATKSRWIFAATAGADVAIDLGPHVSVVPQIRVHVVSRANLSFLGKIVSRPAVVLRARF
jgi:hypothetical protein